MNCARHFNKLSETSAAYVAGLIDGEGIITLTRLHAHENRRAVISIASTEIQLLEFVHRQALSLLEQVLPYLRSYKKRRAELFFVTTFD